MRWFMIAFVAISLPQMAGAQEFPIIPGTPVGQSAKGVSDPPEFSIFRPMMTYATTTGIRTYLRLINPTETQETVTVEIASDTLTSVPTVFGFCDIQVPGYAALQLDEQYFVDCIGQNPGDTVTFVELRFDIGDNLYWQGVGWSPDSGYFSDLSTCHTPVQSHDFLNNVHATDLGNTGYPGFLTLRNTQSAAFDVEIDFYDATNGVFLGTFDSANVTSYAGDLGAFQINMQTMQGSAGIDPADPLYHVNLRIRQVNATTGAAIEGGLEVLNVSVVQTARFELYNMGRTCAY